MTTTTLHRAGPRAACPAPKCAEPHEAQAPRRDMDDLFPYSKAGGRLYRQHDGITEITTVSVPMPVAVTLKSKAFNGASTHDLDMYGLTDDERRAIALGICPELQAEQQCTSCPCTGLVLNPRTGEVEECLNSRGWHEVQARSHEWTGYTDPRCPKHGDEGGAS